MSLRELWLERRHGKQKQQDEHDRDVILAWHIMHIKVKTQNDKRMPSLKSLLSRGQGGSKDQKSVLYQVAGQLGLEVKRVPRG